MIANRPIRSSAAGKSLKSISKFIRDDPEYDLSVLSKIGYIEWILVSEQQTCGHFQVLSKLQIKHSEIRDRVPFLTLN